MSLRGKYWNVPKNSDVYSALTNSVKISSITKDTTGYYVDSTNNIVKVTIENGDTKVKRWCLRDNKITLEERPYALNEVMKELVLSSNKIIRRKWVILDAFIKNEKLIIVWYNNFDGTQEFERGFLVKTCDDAFVEESFLISDEDKKYMTECIDDIRWSI